MGAVPCAWAPEVEQGARAVAGRALGDLPGAYVGTASFLAVVPQQTRLAWGDVCCSMPLESPRWKAALCKGAAMPECSVGCMGTPQSCHGPLSRGKSVSFANFEQF